MKEEGSCEGGRSCEGGLNFLMLFRSGGHVLSFWRFSWALFKENEVSKI